ncbi:MAG: hypothetical protein R3F60_04035 [bacterium]
MLFNSLVFAAFFPVVFALCWGLARAPLRLQNGVLLAASYIFYGFWDWRLLGLIAGSSLVDYVIGRLLAEHVQDARRRKLLVGASLAINLGALDSSVFRGSSSSRPGRCWPPAGWTWAPAPSTSSCPSASASTPSRRCPTPSTSTGAC